MVRVPESGTGTSRWLEYQRDWYRDQQMVRVPESDTGTSRWLEYQ